MTKIAATELCPSQIEKLAAVIAEHPNLAIIRCADEKTGRRFGRAVRRAGMCTKIGSGGRSPGARISAYQIWASWAPADLT